MITDNSSIYKPASNHTLELIKTFNREKQCSFFLSTGFISVEAGQTAFLLNECFNRGRLSHERIRFKSFFANSRHEALQGALKICRARSSGYAPKNSKEVLIYDPDPKSPMQYILDPLERGKEKALIPEMLLFDDLEEMRNYLEDAAYPPAAAVIRAGTAEYVNIGLEQADEFFRTCKDKKVITVLDKWDEDLRIDSGWAHRLSRLPDVLVSGEALTGYEIPFGAFSSSDEIYMPINSSRSSMLHTSTCGGNRMVLTKVRDHLLNNVPELGERKSIRSYCNAIAEVDEERLSAYERYVNPALRRVYGRAGLDIAPVRAQGAKLVFKKKGGEIELLDGASCGGVAVRGHNPEDIIPDVLDKHSKDTDYWESLCRALKEYTQYEHVFPAVSGSGTVDTGILMAMLANREKTRIIVFRGNYSGVNLLSVLATEGEDFRLPFYPLYYDVLYIDPFSRRSADILEKELKSGKVALVWLEVFQGQHMRSVPKMMLDIIMRYRQESGYFIGVDEVLTSMYRMGHLLDSVTRGLKPDIITMFKGLTDATFPHGVTLVNDEVYQQAVKTQPDAVHWAQHAYINQLGAHVSLNVLEKMRGQDQKWQDHVTNISSILSTGLNELAESSPFIHDVRGEGGVLGMTFDFQSRLIKLFGKKAIQLGQIMMPMYMSKLCIKKTGVMFHFNRLNGPLVLSEEDARRLLRNMNATFNSFFGKLSIRLHYPFFIRKKLKNISNSGISGRIQRRFINLSTVFRFLGESFKNRDAVNYYEELGDDLIDKQDKRFTDPTKPLWFNNGYWKDALTYPEACAAMAKLVSDSAKVNAGDTILDVGFGFAEQDFYWLKLYDVKKIIGINITPIQVEVAQNRVKEMKQEDRIDLRLGSATDLQFQDASFEKVLTVESAFNFDTREEFFKEAFRVLKPGGILAATDMLPAPGAKPFGFIKSLTRRHAGIPAANMYDRHEYARKLEEAGFVNVSVINIAEYVISASTKYYNIRKYMNKDIQSTVLELTEEDIKSHQGIKTYEKATGISDYVLVHAEKPLIQ